MNKFTITEFRAMYPDDDACLHKLFTLRYNNLVCKCGVENSFTKVKNRRSYQCSNCGYQIYPTANTVFHKSTTPLTHWFYAIYLQTTTRNGVAAKELERQLNICYKTALRMNHQIKKMMMNEDDILIQGTVEIDEVFLGGKMRNKHKSVRAEAHRTNISHSADKTGVMGFLARGGVVKAEVMNDAKTFKERVRDNVDKSAVIITDSHNAYKGLDLEFAKHEIINHVLDEYERDGYHTNTIEGFWSQLKRTIKGTHISVSDKHLQKYVDEVAFRYMYKDRQEIMFEAILRHVA